MPQTHKISKEDIVQMEKKWTPAQSLAIDTRDKTLLVCAAAGSGKTAALTERIIRSLTDKDSPADIRDMLVVTFTRAAAEELRQRIYSALSDSLSKDPENKHLCEQIINISNARICTIDSFYLDVVRADFDKLDISPSFRTADSAELDVLAKSVMEDTVDDFYEKLGDEFSNLAECFVSVRNSAALSDIFLDLYSSLESIPEGVEFIKEAADKMSLESEGDFFGSSYGKTAVQKILRVASYHLSIYEEVCEKIIADELIAPAYLSTFAYEKDFLSKLVSLAEKENYASAYAHIRSYTSNRLTAPKKGYDKESAELFKSARDEFKGDIIGLSKSFFGISPENISSATKKTAYILDLVYRLLSEFEARFNAEKKQKNVCSFSDIRRYAMKLLVNSDGTPTETAIEYSEKFSQIYIDEYQDVDRVQDMIFRSIAKPTARFMVGDIKQSIYSFRGAEPQVFAAYRKEFPSANTEDSSLPENDSLSIFMSNNFRCDKNVIDFTNAVCSYVFSECADSMGYTAEDDLVFSKITENRACPELPVEVTVIVPSEDDAEESDNTEEELGSKEAEARFIASKICELLRDGKKADGSPIKKNDIAVLFRTNAMGAYVKKALSEANIACSDNTDDRYFENPDVLLTLCLLNVIDNPQRDIYLAGLLRSPFFDFTLDELIEIRHSYSYSYSMYDALCEYGEAKDGDLAKKCRDFNERLSSYRDAAASLTVDKLLRYLYDSDIFASSGLVYNDTSDNLQRLYEYARSFEGSSFKGLYNFIVYINKIIEEKTKLSSPPASSSEGQVTLMNIHQSKGLEFPVCFVCNTCASFDSKENRESLVFNASCGIAMKISDGSGYARVNTPMREAVLCTMNVKQAEEEMRILYVALTRARERLFVTGATRSRAEKLIQKAERSKRYKSKYTVLSAHSYMDWVLSALYGTDTEFCRIEFLEKNKITPSYFNEGKDLTSQADTAEISVHDEDTKQLLRERFSFVYPYEEATRLPAKISVSELVEGTQSTADNEDTLHLFREAHEYSAPSILISSAREEKHSAAKRGTATHLFLQFCNFENAEKQGVENELCRLIDKKFIPKDSEALVYKNELEAFFSSDFYRMIRSAKSIVREQRFNILTDASVLNTDSAVDEVISVQGVIDLVFEDCDGNITLCDYKTDRLTPAELLDDALLTKKMTERHAKQLSFYKTAAEKLFGKECNDIYVYSTHAARAVKI